MERTTQTASDCPDCEASVSIDHDPVPGEIVHCPRCRLEAEVVAIDPVRLAPAPEIEEDWGE